jgi:hypothetical protein
MLLWDFFSYEICHNPIFDPFLLIILFTEKMMKKMMKNE